MIKVNNYIIGGNCAMSTLLMTICVTLNMKKNRKMFFYSQKTNKILRKRQLHDTKVLSF